MRMILAALTAMIPCCMEQPPANVYTFEEGVNGCACYEDTSIFSESDFAGGGTDGIFSGTNAQLNARRALLKVDLSSIPQGSVVTSVELTLTVEMSGGSYPDIPYSLHALSRGWTEGTVVGGGFGGYGGHSSPGDTTWVEASKGEEPWSTPGGDFVAEASAVANAGYAGQTALWSGPGLVADVQRWVDVPDQNHGWIIVSEWEGERQRVKRFRSSESDSGRPRLTVTVAPPAAR